VVNGSHAAHLSSGTRAEPGQQQAKRWLKSKSSVDRLISIILSSSAKRSLGEDFMPTPADCFFSTFNIVIPAKAGSHRATRESPCCSQERPSQVDEWVPASAGMTALKVEFQ
jgi:hypothetical protein